MSISRVTEPSEEGPKFPFLRRVSDPGASYEGLSLARSIFWVYTHFDLKMHRTFVCNSTREPDGRVVESETCQQCQQQDPTRLRGYLHVWAIAPRREEFLEITPETWRHCKLSWPVVPSLRGWRITATRGKGKTSRLALFLSEPSLAQDLGKLPPEKSPEECLRHAMR